MYSSLLHAHASVHSNICNVVAWQRLKTTEVSFPLPSNAVTGLSYQLLTATAHNDLAPTVL
jgi:hypothetical protein